MKMWFIILFSFACAENLFAEDAKADFSMANKFYAEGKFPEAAKLYEKILQTDGQSPSLLFNYGNAEFKAGHLGKAIAAYRRAELISPRDPEVRANLDFVRKQVQGAPLRESWWQNWIGLLSLNEGAWLTAALFWLLFAALAARQIHPTLATKLRTATRVVAVLTVFSGAVLALQVANHFNSSIAVVTINDAVARSGPFEEAQNGFTAHDGAELSILSRHDDWIQVQNRAGEIGWLNLKQAEVLPGA